jgi:hypothetical protein
MSKLTIACDINGRSMAYPEGSYSILRVAKFTITIWKPIAAVELRP